MNRCVICGVRRSEHAPMTIGADAHAWTAPVEPSSAFEAAWRADIRDARKVQT